MKTVVVKFSVEKNARYFLHSMSAKCIRICGSSADSQCIKRSPDFSSYAGFADKIEWNSEWISLNWNFPVVRQRRNSTMERIIIFDLAWAHCWAQLFILVAFSLRRTLLIAKNLPRRGIITCANRWKISSTSLHVFKIDLIKAQKCSVT